MSDSSYSTTRKGKRSLFANQSNLCGHILTSLSNMVPKLTGGVDGNAAVCINSSISRPPEMLTFKDNMLFPNQQLTNAMYKFSKPSLNRRICV